MASRDAMKPVKKRDVLLENLTLADARKRIEEFRHLKPVDAKSRTTPAPAGNATKGATPKGKR
jgi:hypothetical protein